MQGYNINYLLEMLTQQNNHLKTSEIKKLKYKIEEPIISQSEYQAYPDSIKKLFHEIFYNPNTQLDLKNQSINLKKVLCFTDVPTSMPICNKRLVQRQITFRCYDCMTHEASIICKTCFENGNHKGHRYTQMASGGGNCDCGNPDAIKEQGFCKDHPGKADPVHVDKQEEEYFLTHFLILFEWFFRLYENFQHVSADQLGQVIAIYLITLNEESLYYNTLTYKLLYHKISVESQQTIIEKVFETGIKCMNFARKMTNLFFTMFSLEIFKYQLTISYCKAYNKLKNFQKSKFKQLYIQLYANNDLVQKMITEQKIVLNPYSKNYDFMQYIQNLMFISTIKQHVAAKFFQFLMQKTIIELPELDVIEQQIQNQLENHIVNILNQNLNSENAYYSLNQTIIKLLKNNVKILKIMFTNYSDAILDTEYSYIRNKVVLPFHKVLAMIILVLFQGNLQKFDIKKLQQFVQGELDLLKISEKVFRLILRCYSEVALTYFQNSYLDNYIQLYIRSGLTIIIYDQIMFKICLKIFQQTNNTQKMNEIIEEVFQLKHEQTKKSKKNSNQLNKQKIEEEQNYQSMLQQNQDWEDFDEMSDKQIELRSQNNQKITLLKKNIKLIKIIIENCISDRADLKVSSSLQLNNQYIKQKTQILISELLNNFKQMNHQNLKLIVRHFKDGKNAEEEFIKTFMTMDKNKKKYIINSELTQKISKQKLPLSLFPTLKKIGQIFANQTKNQQQTVDQYKCSQQALLRLRIFFNPAILKKLTHFYYQNLLALKENLQINKIFLDFYDTMQILKSLLQPKESEQIQSFFIAVKKISQNEQFSFLNQKLKEKNQEEQSRKKKQNLMKKFQDKKLKRLMEMKKKQQTYEKIQEEQIQQLCIICRQDDKSSGLCLLANFNYSNTLQILNKAQGRSLSFNSCFHPIHLKCFLKSSKQNDSIPCPLCKNPSNIMLPTYKQIENLDMIREIYERIITMKLFVNQLYDGYDKKLDENGILCILRSISSTIDKNIMKNQTILNQKSQRLLNTIYNFLTTVFRKVLNKKQAQEQVNAIQNFLNILKNKANSQICCESNYYSTEYLTLKILYLCMVHQSDKCSDILCESIINSINRQDARRIWQMCNQLVTLPAFKMRESQQGINKSIDQMYKKISYYQPPRFIKDLLIVRDSDQMSCKNGHQMCICLICQTKLCLDCKQLRKHFSKIHCEQGLSFNLMTGGFIYKSEQKLIDIPSLYYNSIGVEWKPSKSGEGFQFDYGAYKQMTDQIINESVLKYLCLKYSDLMKKNLIIQNFF